MEQNERISSKADLKEQWTLYVDGLSNSTESGIGLILTGLEGDVDKNALHFKFLVTNNEALIFEFKLQS